MLSLYNSRYKKELHLFNACLHGNRGTVQFLLTQKANPNTSKLTPLHVACSQQHSKIVQLLLTYKAHVNQPDDLHRTPLHLACCTGNIGIIGMLLKAKADVTLRAGGQTALQMALAQGSTFIPFLLLYGAPALQK